MMTDYRIKLQEDWNDLLEEIGTLLQANPMLTALEIEEITGADYEDVLWAMSKAK